LICVDPSPTSTSTPTNPPVNKSHCLRRSWLGFCREWSTMSNEWKEEI
jgi:lipase ATG15